MAVFLFMAYFRADKYAQRRPRSDCPGAIPRRIAAPVRPTAARKLLNRGMPARLMKRLLPFVSFPLTSQGKGMIIPLGCLRNRVTPASAFCKEPSISWCFACLSPVPCTVMRSAAGWRNSPGIGFRWTKAHCIRACTGWKRRAGSARNSAAPKTIGARDSTRLPREGQNNWKRSEKNGGSSNWRSAVC
jgi:hypothetical protein